MENIPYILAIIFGFGFLIFVHELGHFGVAKYFKVRCPYFAIGMGVAGAMPPVIAWRKGIGLRIFKGTDREYEQKVLAHMATKPEGVPKEPTRRQMFEVGDELGLGETEYRWMLLPLGGYVAMEGQEDLDPTSRSDDPRAFNNQPLHARLAILSAGVVMNVIFGFLFFIIAFSIGVKFPAANIGYVASDSPAALAYPIGADGDESLRGLRPGDQVLTVDGEEVQEFQMVQMTAALAAPGKAVELVVERAGVDEPLIFSMVPVPDPSQEDILMLGISPGYETEVGVIFGDETDRETGVYADGLRPGMILTSIGGEPVTNYGDYYRVVTAARGAPVAATFTDDIGVTVETSLSSGGVLANELALFGLEAPLMVSVVVEKSPAARAGFEIGDVLVRFGDTNWPTDWQADIVNVVLANEAPIPVSVLREGAVVELEPVKPRKKFFGLFGTARVGLAASPAFDLNFVVAGADAPNALKDLAPGSQLTAINGTPVTSWNDAVRVLADSEATGALSLTLESSRESGGESGNDSADEEALVVEVPFSDAQLATIQALTYFPSSEVGFQPSSQIVKADGPIDAVGIGMVKTKFAAVQVYQTLMRLFQGTVGVKNLRGPVGIIAVGQKVARQGLPWFLYFLGLISINLAVLNFLPLPIVDGGHVLMALVEKARGKPASAGIQKAIFLVGLLLLGSLFLIVSFHDVVRELF